MTAERWGVVGRGVNAVVCVNGWAGRREIPVEIVKETRHRYVVKFTKRTLFFGRFYEEGETRYVPKTSVRII